MLGVAVLVLVGVLVNHFYRPVPRLPADVGQAGAQLDSGLLVEPGSVLLGPVLVDEVDAGGTPKRWSAVLAVTGEPLEVWNRYLTQLAKAIPAMPLTFQGQGNPGCERKLLVGLSCLVEADGVLDSQLVNLTASMRSIRGDVTGRYLINMTVSRRMSPIGRPDSKGSKRVERAPAPPRAYAEPEVGDSIRPTRLPDIFEGDDYVLLEGSKLRAVWDDGNIKGGFGVLLKVDLDADLEAVRKSYERQAAGREVKPTELRYHDTTVTVSGTGASGPDGVIWAVDQPGKDADYIYYQVSYET